MSGGVSVEGNSTIQDTIKIQYSIPSATLNGQPFEIYLELPPAPVGGSISEDKFFDFSGYILDLTGAGDLFAAGYLHGLINSQSQQECLEKGTNLSSKIIQQIGARF